MNQSVKTIAESMLLPKNKDNVLILIKYSE